MKNCFFAIVVLTSLKFLDASAQNVLTEQEKSAGWKLLFDGTTTKGWHTYGTDKMGEAWKAENGMLYLDTSKKLDGQTIGGGDITTNQEFENFELALEWKIQPCGNSGIMYCVVESKENKASYNSSPEMQVLDNTCHPDAKIIKHRTGDLYDLISSLSEPVKPVGEWNAVRIISNKGNIEFWLNGVMVVKFTMHTPAWDELVRNSKFKDMPAFGKARKGHFALQDHGDQVWFRNIKVREIQ